MSYDPLMERLFEMKLAEIYRKYSWLEDELSLKQFTDLFPVTYKHGKPLKPDMPAEYDLDKHIFLDVLVAFRQSFH